MLGHMLVTEKAQACTNDRLSYCTERRLKFKLRCKGQLPLRYAASELVCDLLASWTA